MLSTSTVKSLLAPILAPLGVMDNPVISMWIGPLVTAGIYTAIASVAMGDKKYVYNILLSAGSEWSASIIDRPLNGLLLTGPPTVGTTASPTIAYAYPKSSVLG